MYSRLFFIFHNFYLVDKSEIVHANKTTTTTTQTIVKSDVESTTTTKKTTIIHENTPVIDIKTQKSTVKTDENEISTTNVPDDKEGIFCFVIVLELIWLFY